MWNYSEEILGLIVNTALRNSFVIIDQENVDNALSSQLSRLNDRETIWRAESIIFDLLVNPRARKSENISTILAPILDWVDYSVRNPFYEDTPENKGSNDYFKMRSLLFLSLFLYHADDKLRNLIMEKADQLRNDPALEGMIRNRAGGVIATACFIRPNLFSQYDIFNLDAETANKMANSSPMWRKLLENEPKIDFSGYDPRAILWLQSNDHSRIYEISANNPGKPIVRTLFEDANLTCLGYYPQEILQHQYENRDKLTGKQMFFIIHTKHNWNGYDFSSHLTPQYLDKFDPVIIEPGEVLKIPGIALPLIAMKGITSKDDPAGPKINLLSFSGHGAMEGIELVVPQGKEISEFDLVQFGIFSNGDDIGAINQLKSGETSSLSHDIVIVKRNEVGNLELRWSEQEISNRQKSTGSVTDDGDYFLDKEDMPIIKALEPYVSGQHAFSLPLSDKELIRKEFASFFKVHGVVIDEMELRPIYGLENEKDRMNVTVHGKAFNAFVSQGRINVCAQAESFSESCFSAKEDRNATNIAELLGKTLKVKNYGAQRDSGPINLEFEQNASGQWHIKNIDYGVPHTSYDYCNTALLLLKSASITLEGGQNVIKFDIENRGEAVHYAIERSIDGRDFEEIGRLPAAPSGSYIFTEPAQSGNVTYRIKEANLQMVGTDGSKAYTYGFTNPMEVGTASALDETLQTPLSIAIDSIHPNPFAALATISYSIPKQERVTISIYDMTGKKVSTLVDREMSEGTHTTAFRAGDSLPAGLYICEMVAGKERLSKKMLLQK